MRAVPVLETFVLLKAEQQQREEWRCASMESGELFAMTFGVKKKHKLSAGNWDLLMKVVQHPFHV